ncbi:hypothetical protein NQ317_019885 [Molorchus minor]|uniref:TTI1 N-terminal TPR domain-containing protein n=1 Tax=Molorchus minor TaxID=1323400 RepID=A0ABQ9JAH5_9CUCU|nr:hypothetical protein NQ317_019885 [Molorchus minor]
MNRNIESFEHFTKLKALCRNVIQNPKDVEYVKEIKSIIENSPQTFINAVQPTILSTFYPILKGISENKSSFRDDEKQIIVDTLKNLFDKSVIDKLGLFFNIYSFLLFEIYDHLQHKVLPIYEEYKLSIMQCMTSLAKSVSSELILTLYTKENSPKLCQMLYVAVEIAKTEQLRSLRYPCFICGNMFYLPGHWFFRIAAIECIMAIGRVLRDHDFADIEIRNHVAEMFLFFLPGVASGLKRVALEDEKVGHKVPMMKKFDFAIFKNSFHKSCSQTSRNKIKPKDDYEIKEYLQTTKRSTQWYRDTDKRLQPLVNEFVKLTHHSHPKVRLELATMCGLVVQNCYTMRNGEVNQRSTTILEELSNNLSMHTFKTLLESIEEGFYNGIISLPRKLYGIDEREQLAALNLIIGYINLFGKHKLQHVLLSSTYLDKLMNTLIHVSELEKSSVSLLEEYKIQDLEITAGLKTTWKNFRHFKEDSVREKLEKLCSLLAKSGAFMVISDFLLDVFMYQEEHRKEATFILNEAITGVEHTDENIPAIKNILNTYLDSTYWQIPLSVVADEFGYVNTLPEVQNNVIQVCLLVDGVGKIALALNKHLEQFLLKTLYSVLERAGNGNPLVNAAGLSALNNIAYACGCSSIPELINKNIDFLTFHIERKLNRIQENNTVLDVLTVVMRYSNVDILQNIAYTVKEHSQNINLQYKVPEILENHEPCICYRFS